jgi:hypothetical protein
VEDRLACAERFDFNTENAVQQKATTNHGYLLAALPLSLRKAFGFP